MSFSNWAEIKVLDHVVRRVDYVTTVVTVGLCTANPGEAGTGDNCNEVGDANGYSRIITGGGVWAPAAGGQLSNAQAITFPPVTGAGWGEVNYFALFDDLLYGAGNMIVYGLLVDAPIEIIAGSVPRFDIGTLIVLLN